MIVTMAVDARQALGMLTRLEQLNDLRDPFREVGKRLREKMAVRFSSEGFGRWAALSPGYASWKAQHFPGKKILELTGRLRGSLVNAGGDHQEHIEHIGHRWQLVFGTKVPYGAFHQYGARRMPARPFLDLDAADEAMVASVMEEYVRAFIRRAGGA